MAVPSDADEGVIENMREGPFSELLDVGVYPRFIAVTEHGANTLTHVNVDKIISVEPCLDRVGSYIRLQGGPMLSLADAVVPDAAGQRRRRRARACTSGATTPGQTGSSSTTRRTGLSSASGSRAAPLPAASLCS